MEALRQLVRGDGLLALRLQVREAAEVDRQAAGGQLGDRVAVGIGRRVIAHGTA